MGCLRPSDFDQAQPRFRLRQIGCSAAHVEIGRQPGFEAQGHDPQRLPLEIGRFGQQFQLRPRPAVFDILRGDGGGDQAALVGAYISRLGIARSRRAHFCAQAPGKIGVEGAEQPGTCTRSRSPLAHIDACLGRSVDRGKPVRALCPQQGFGGCQSPLRRCNIEVRRKAAIDQRIQHRIGKGTPPHAVHAGRRQVRPVAFRRSDLRLGQVGGNRGTSAEQKRERAQMETRSDHAGAIVMSSSMSSISSCSLARSTLRGLPKRATPR